MEHSRKVSAPLVFVLLALLVTVSACQAQPRTQDEVPRIAPSVLKGRLDAGENVLVVDARTLGEYTARHIPGAISVPLSEIEARMDELPRDPEIVLY